VGDAVANRGARVDEIAIAPLGVPRPGAGQFYLRHTNTSPAQAPTERPTREWGARPDTPVARSLKGRKYYWHGDPAVQTPPRHIARLGQADTLATRAEVVNPTATFTCRLTFENLTRSELGGLLAALDPARALDAVVPAGWSASHQIAGRLGGGKPLGLGSVQVNGLELELHSAGGRYLVTGDEKSPSIDDLIADFVTAVPKSVAATWPDLAAVLDIGHVKPEVIWYPPALPWSQSHEEKFEPGFEFWKASAGRYLHPNNPRSPENIIPLKEPRDPDQYLDIVIGDGH
jgi:CRISPR-associated protein (TIGR03986 family)